MKFVVNIWILLCEPLSNKQCAVLNVLGVVGMLVQLPTKFVKKILLQLPTKFVEKI